MTYRVTDEEYNATREWVRDYINRYCIVRDTPMPGKLHGTTYEWIFRLRRGLFNADFAVAIAKMFIYKMERIDIDLNFQVTGLETAATPMVTAITLVSKVYGANINAFVVRKKRKEYGLLDVFEGRPNQKLSVMVDDLCNSGGSLAQCYHILNREDMAVASTAFVIVNKSNEGAHSTHRLHSDMGLPDDINVISLFTLADFGLSNPSH